jgi:DNA-directed RNA polymerase subunit RPC12/RpoP
MKILRSLSETHPNLLAEWDYGKNSPLTPKDITAGSHKKVWWRCKHGHSWKAEVKSRIGSLSRAKGTGCPYCHNKKVLIGFNDLATTNPDLAAEWDYGKNNPLTPKDVVAGSNKRVWWRCKYGHSWKVSVANRNKGSRCPHCNSQFKTSFSEQALFY